MRQSLTRLALLFSGWLLVSGAAECAFRLLGDRPSLDLQHLYGAFGQESYRLAPNVDTAANWSSGRLTVHTDELGLRCDSERRFATRNGETIDALFLGDSQGFGNGVAFEDSLAGAAVVAAARDGFRLANASVGGHSASTQLELAAWLNDQHTFKARNYVLLVTPAIAQGGDHIVHALVGKDGRLYDGQPGFLAECRLWTKTHLVTYARIRDAARNSGIGVENNNDVPFIFGFYEAGSDAEQRRQQAFNRFVARLKKFASAEGARVHLVYVPLTLEMDFAPIKAAAAARGMSVDRDAPLRACTEAARTFGLTVENLRPALEALHAKGDRLHLPGDFHYDAELSRVCGARMWEALRPALLKAEPIVSNQR
jgi:hypothetical protein